jgi:hypothetical protein
VTLKYTDPVPVESDLQRRHLSHTVKHPVPFETVHVDTATLENDDEGRSEEC